MELVYLYDNPNTGEFVAHNARCGHGPYRGRATPKPPTRGRNWRGLANSQSLIEFARACGCRFRWCCHCDSPREYFEYWSSLEPETRQGHSANWNGSPSA